jgi:hypothetical protein
MAELGSREGPQRVLGDAERNQGSVLRFAAVELVLGVRILYRAVRRINCDAASAWKDTLRSRRLGAYTRYFLDRSLTGRHLSLRCQRLAKRSGGIASTMGSNKENRMRQPKGLREMEAELAKLQSGKAKLEADRDAATSGWGEKIARISGAIDGVELCIAALRKPPAKAKRKAAPKDDPPAGTEGGADGK